MMRANTPLPILTLDSLSYVVESQAREIDALHVDAEATDKALSELEHTIIELAGKSGRDGYVGKIEERFKDSATSQGTRIGKLEADVAKLTQTKAQLLVLAAIGMALLGAVASAWFR